MFFSRGEQGVDTVPWYLIHKLPYVTLHAKRGLMDFTENREFFSRSRCMNFNFHSVKCHDHSTTKNFHSWRETNHAMNDQ